MFFYVLCNNPFPDVPSPPRNLSIKEVNKDYIVVSWEVPEHDGESPITGYVIEKRDVKKSSYINAGNVDGKTLEFKVPKLIEGNEYIIRVFAENEIGRSEPAETSEPVKARLPFGKYFKYCFPLNMLNSFS